MKLIHRFEVKVMSGEENQKEGPSTVITSFYRGHLDGAYQAMVSEMLEYGCFDNFVCSVIRSVVVDGESISIFIRCIFITVYFLLIMISFTFKEKLMPITQLVFKPRSLSSPLLNNRARIGLW